MTAVQYKTEIVKRLDHVSEEVLKDVLNFIENSERQLSIREKRYKNFEKILSEDDKLFERLAK